MTTPDSSNVSMLGKFVSFDMDPNTPSIADSGEPATPTLGKFMNFEVNTDDGSSVPDDDQQDSPPMEGEIRSVPGAALSSKRKDGTTGRYTELWVYNRDPRDIQHELGIRRAILDVTDINGDRLHSPDGTQQARVWNCGNVEFLEIVGLST